MATVPQDRFDNWFVAPFPPARLIAVALAVLVAGAAYCQGYERLVQGGDDWGGSLLWSAYSIVPWFLLVELIKWRHPAWQRKGSRIAAALVGVGAASIGIETLLRTIGGDGLPPLYLMVMRRLPPMLVALLLILVGVRLAESKSAFRRDASQRLRLLSPSIAWIAAADNYVELHIDGRTELLRMTMADAQAQLEGLGFRRIHRRYIVNPSHLSELSSADCAVCMRDGTILPIGRAFAQGAMALR